jgi:hypothetical protein
MSAAEQTRTDLRLAEVTATREHALWLSRAKMRATKSSKNRLLQTVQRDTSSVVQRTFATRDSATLSDRALTACSIAMNTRCI